MSLFKQLEIIKIPREDLENLTEKQIIRIEKKLKAEIVLTKRIDINEVNQLLSVLRDSKPFLKQLLNDSMNHFHQIVENPKELIYFTSSSVWKENQSDEFKDFIIAKFGNELRVYIQECIQSKHYRALNALLYYRAIFTESFLEEIQLKLIRKLDYGIECLHINANQLDDKIEFLYNPYFFRCFNYFEKTNQEKYFIKLTNSIVRKLKSNRTLYRILFSMGHYLAIGTNLKKTAKNNKSVASSKGVYNQFNYKKHPKGGTVCKLDNYKNSRIKHLSRIFGVIIGALASIFIFAGIVSHINNTRKQFSPFSTHDSLIQFTENVTTHQKLISNYFFNETAVYFHEDSLGLEYQQYKLNYPKLTTIKNHTKKYLIIAIEHLDGYYLVCVNPFSERKTRSVIKNYVIYKGLSPVIFEYIDRGKTKKGFKFNTFDMEDFLYLEKFNTTKVNMIPYDSYEFNIFDNYEFVQKTETIK